MIPLVPLSGTFYRIVFARYASAVLQGAVHAEGRFHHNGQPALYASPSPDTAAIAIDRYVGSGDAPRVLIPLHLSNAKLADLRDPATCAALAIAPAVPSVPWADQRASGLPATSWQASDAARATSADGIIYASRTMPTRWHIVLFRWNSAATDACLTAETPTPWTLPRRSS